MSTTAPMRRQRASAMGRRGLGARRVAGALREARIGEEDAEAVAPGIQARAVDAALTFARRQSDRAVRCAGRGSGGAAAEKQLGAMLRAGHPLDLARRIVDAPQGSEPSQRASGFRVMVRHDFVAGCDEAC